MSVALLAEGVDRNFATVPHKETKTTSPSSRRAWIEIDSMPCRNLMKPSPSSRRAWIEMVRT